MRLMRTENKGEERKKRGYRMRRGDEGKETRKDKWKGKSDDSRR